MTVKCSDSLLVEERSQQCLLVGMGFMKCCVFRAHCCVCGARSARSSQAASTCRSRGPGTSRSRVSPGNVKLFLNNIVYSDLISTV